MNKNQNPFLVSVVLPTRDRAHTLTRAIQSVLNQSYSNLELIIVDDGSSDSTEELVKGIRDKRILYIKNDISQGSNAARNIGCRATKGKYIAFQDSDDEWLPDKLHKQVIALYKSGQDVRVSFCGFRRMKGKKSTYIPKHIRGFKSGEWNYQLDLLEGNFITTQTLIVEKSLLFEIGLFDEKLQRFQDWDLAIRLSTRSLFAFVDEPLVSAFITPDSISTKSNLFILSTENIISKHRDLFKACPPALTIQQLNMAVHSAKEFLPLTFAKYLLKAFRPCYGSFPILTVSQILIRRLGNLLEPKSYTPNPKTD